MNRFLIEAGGRTTVYRENSERQNNGSMTYMLTQHYRKETLNNEEYFKEKMTKFMNIWQKISNEHFENFL